MNPFALARVIQAAIAAALWLVLPLPVLACYVVVGLVLAARVCPLSFPFGVNAITCTLLWPWPVAGHIVFKLRGQYPRWMLPL